MNIAAMSEMTVEEVEKVLLNFSQYVVKESMDCWRIAPILGWFGFQGTCGGSHPMPDFMPTFKNLAVDIRMRFGKPALAYMEDQFQAENVGHHSILEPVITRVTNMWKKLPNCYTAGKPMQVELANGKGGLDTSDALQGVFFRSSTGIKTRATEYAYCKGSLLAFNAPAGLTGPQQLSVSLVLNDSLRTGVWAQELSPMTSSESAETPPSAEEATPSGEVAPTTRNRRKADPKDVELMN